MTVGNREVYSVRQVAGKQFGLAANTFIKLSRGKPCLAVAGVLTVPPAGTVRDRPEQNGQADGRTFAGEELTGLLNDTNFRNIQFQIGSE